MKLGKIGVVLFALLFSLSAAAQIAIDRFPGARGLMTPATHAFVIVPHDTNQLSFVTRALWVGGGGNIVVVTSGGSTVTLIGVLGGTLLPIRVRIVKATGTTATSMVGLY